MLVGHGTTRWGFAAGHSRGTRPPCSWLAGGSSRKPPVRGAVFDTTRRPEARQAAACSHSAD